MTKNKIKELDDYYSKKIVVNCCSRDYEADHTNADALLCELLEHLGFTKTASAYDDVEKWYS